MSTQSQKPTYVQRILRSLKGILGGFLLLFIAVVVLWRNEGRTDFSAIAENSIPIEAEVVSSRYEGEFVAARGALTAVDSLGDGEFLYPGPYLRLERQVEMFAWSEESETEGETTTTSYVQRWTSHPADSSRFDDPTYVNPPLTIEETRRTAAAGRLGGFAVDLRNMQLPSLRDLPLERDMLLDTGLTLVGDSIYIGEGTLANPAIGDVRISFHHVPTKLSVTVFGEQQGRRIVPYLEDRDTSLYRAYEGSREAGIAAMRSSYRTSGSVNRVLGFGLMWGGLTLLFAPISVLLSGIPALENLSRTLIRLLTFGIAFVFSLIIIVISAIAHSTIAMVLLGLMVAGMLLLARRDDLRKRAVPF